MLLLKISWFIFWLYNYILTQKKFHIIVNKNININLFLQMTWEKTLWIININSYRDMDFMGTMLCKGPTPLVLINRFSLSWSATMMELRQGCPLSL